MNEAKIMIEGKNLIKKANELNQSYYKLKEVTQRVLAIAVEQAQHIERQTGENLILNGTKVIVCADYYAKVYGVDINTAYDALRVAVKDMYYAEYVWEEMGKRGKNNQFRTRFVSHIGYLNGESSVEFILTEMARKHIYEITRNYTIYEITNLSRLNKYSIRLYELLAQWRSVGKVEYDLEEFRLKLGVDPTEYTHISNFKKRVLDHAVQQINTHTDLNIEYEQVKKGRVITGFSFKFKQKKPKQAEIATETLKTTSDSLNTIKPLTEPQIAKYSMILCKLGSISDLSNFPDYPTFANWIGNILRDPKNSNQETVKRVFKALKTETDYGKKN